MATLKHTKMREDFSLVNARQFSAERSDVTIAMALDAIGGLFRTLLLTDEEDGIWTINANLTIPANVLLQIPLGVTLVGPGDITVLGGLTALRWPVHLGPGSILWQDSTLGLTAARLVVGDGTFDTLHVETNAIIDGQLTVGPSMYFDFPIGPNPYTYQHSIVMEDAGDPLARFRFGMILSHKTQLNSDSVNLLYGIHSSQVVYVNGYHHGGAAIGVVGWCDLQGDTGTVDLAAGTVGAIFQHMPSGVLTDCICLWAEEVPDFATNGPITNYYGLVVDNTPRGTNAYGVDSRMLAGTNRFNLFMRGTAVNYMAGALTIGGGAPYTGAFLLTVNGTAGKPGGGSFADTSDRRLKTHVRPLDDALSLLVQFGPTVFEWVEPGHAAVLPGPQFGFVADDLEAVLPQWVGHTADGYKTLNPVGLDALLVRAIQQLQSRLLAVETHGAPVARGGV